MPIGPHSLPGFYLTESFSPYVPGFMSKTRTLGVECTLPSNRRYPQQGLLLSLFIYFAYI